MVRAAMRTSGTWESIERVISCGCSLAVPRGSGQPAVVFQWVECDQSGQCVHHHDHQSGIGIGHFGGLLGTSITARKLLGIFIGGGGAVALLILSAQQESLHASWQGDLMILLNAASYGFYLVMVKPLMAKYKPLTVIAWVFVFGALFVLPIGWQQAAAIDWSAFEPAHWQGVAYVVIGTTFMAYLLNIFALRHVQPTVVSIYIYLQPLAYDGAVVVGQPARRSGLHGRFEQMDCLAQWRFSRALRWSVYQTGRIISCV